MNQQSTSLTPSITTDGNIKHEDQKIFSILENEFIFDETPNGIYFPSTSSFIYKISLIEKFVTLIETTEITFVLPKRVKFAIPREEQSSRRRIFSKQVFKCIEKKIFNLYGMDQLTDKFTLSLRAQLFLETYLEHAGSIVSMGIDEGVIPQNILAYNRCIDSLNIFINALREKAQASEFRRKLAHRREKSKRQLESIHSLVDEALARHARLLVIRVDFAYENSQSPTAVNVIEETQDNLTLITRHREQFTNNMRHNSEIFGNCVGYILKLEQGLLGGFHLHGFFLFNGSEVKSDYYYGNKIGEYWIKTTMSSTPSSPGRYYNCSASRKKYKRDGIGLVNYFDLSKINIIKTDVLGYFAKESLYLMPKNLGSIKTLTRSSIASIKANKGLVRGPKRNKADKNWPEKISMASRL